MMNVKVLGGGCSKCETLLANAKEAIEKAGVKAEVEYITDMEQVMSYGVMRMPAIVVHVQVVSMDKKIKTAQVEEH